MDRVAVAQLIFSGTSTEASFLSIFPADVTDTFWLCNDFANRDQKSLFASFQSHSSISSIKSVNELQCHSVNMRANCASNLFYDIFMLHALVNVLQQGLCEYSILIFAPDNPSPVQELVLQLTHWNTLPYTAIHCNTLQHTATRCNTTRQFQPNSVTHCNTATHCNTRNVSR